MIEIKRDGKVFYTLEDVCEGSKLSRQLMDHHYIILKFTTVGPVYFEIGDSVEIADFGYFELTSAYFPKQGDNGGYEYELQLDAYYMAWKNKICKYRPQFGSNETSFSLTTSVGVHMNVVLGNLKALGLKYNGKDYTVDYTTYNKDAFDVERRFFVSYDSVSILDAITSISETLECEWWIDGSIIYLGTCELVGQTTFEQGVNVKSMSFSESKASYITRLYAFGSDKNIPKGYFTGSETDVTTDGIATDYLMLPTQETDEDGFVAKDGYLENVNVVKNPAQAIEGVVKFDEEYPKVECAVSGIKTYDSTAKNDDGTTTTQTFWQVTSDDSFAIKFEKSWIKENLTLMIKFTSGALLGMEFEVAYKIIDKKNYFEIVANETYGRTLPDKNLCPKNGDKFFLYNWDATKITETDLIQKAQLSLLERSKTYYKKSMISNANFDCEMDADDFYNDGTYDYHPLGELVKLINPMFADVDKDGNHYRNSRIIGMEINLDIPYDAPTYIVGEKAAYSKLGQLEDKVDSITVNGMQIGSSGSGGGGVYVIGLNDSTPATDSNVYSARRVRNDFLSKLHDDTAKGSITFEQLQKFLKGLSIGSQGQYGITENGESILSAIQSLDFLESAQSGFSISKMGNGNYKMLISALEVWGKAIFHELEVRKLSYVGGDFIFSPAGSKLMRVVPAYKVSEDGKVSWTTEQPTTSSTVDGWKCYLLADDGSTSTMNMWKVGDQAQCKTFNIKAGVYENVANRYYWRLVEEVSSENETITDADGNVLYDGMGFAWVILSATDYDKSMDNDTPQAEDTIVCVGNRYDTDRQNVIMISTQGDNAPSLAGYKNVRQYFLTKEGENHIIFLLSPSQQVFASETFKWINYDGSRFSQTIYRGEWVEGQTYYINEQVDHEGTLWQCVTGNDSGTTDEPTEENTASWRAMTPIKGYQMVIDQSLDGSIAPSEEETVTCTILDSWNKDVTGKFTIWAVTRDSGDAPSDQLWNVQHQNVGNVFKIAFSDLGINGLEGRLSSTFHVVATDAASDRSVGKDITFSV